MLSSNDYKSAPIIGTPDFYQSGEMTTACRNAFLNSGSTSGPSYRTYVNGHITAEDIVKDLIIDDGFSGREYRWPIFNPSYNLIGVYSGPTTSSNGHI